MGLDMSLYNEKEEEIGYWRKANQIHKWFWEKLAPNNEDINCKKLPVTIEQLKELKGICEEVLKDTSKADELLPTKDGFFYGGIDYDEYYFQELEDTIHIIDNILKYPPKSIVYHAW